MVDEVLDAYATGFADALDAVRALNGTLPPAIAKFNPHHDEAGRFSEGDGLEAAAIAHFGLTDNPHEAGFVTPTGKLLDLSGRHQAEGYHRDEAGFNVVNVHAGGRKEVDWFYGERNVDHRELEDLWAVESGVGSREAQLTAFMAQGFVRVSSSRGNGSDRILGVQFSRPMTESQLRAVRSSAREHSSVWCEVENPDSGRILYSGEYSEGDPANSTVPSMEALLRESNDVARSGKPSEKRRIRKYNPFHDERGRFAEADGGGGTHGVGDLTMAEAREHARLAVEALWGKGVEVLDDDTGRDFKVATAEKIAAGLQGNSAFAMFGRVAVEDTAGAVRMFIGGWAGTSGDTQPWAVAMQLAAEKEFGIEGAAHPWIGIPDVTSDWTHENQPGETSESLLMSQAVSAEEATPGARAAFLRTMYEGTQADLASKGIEGLWLYRGSTYHEHPGDPADIDPFGQPVRTDDVATFQPMSSFSLEPGVAKGFGGTYSYGRLDAAWVPADRILCYPGTGFGCLEESEVVVLGGTMNVSTVTWPNLPYRSPTPGDSRQSIWQVEEALFLSERRATPMTKAAKPRLPSPDLELHNADWPKRRWDLTRDPEAFHRLFPDGLDPDLPVAEVMPTSLRHDLIDAGYLALAGPRIRKYNEHHDEAGRFASADGTGDGKPFGAAYNKAQREAMLYYTGTGYEIINPYLRDLAEPSDYTQEAVAALRSACRPSTQPMTLYRGTLAEAFGVEDNGNVQTADELRELVGTVVHDPGFLSTTTDKGLKMFERASVQLILRVPKGTPMARIPPGLPSVDEGEVVLAPGVGLKITSVKFVDSPYIQHGTSIVRATVVP